MEEYCNLNICRQHYSALALLFMLHERMIQLAFVGKFDTQHGFGNGHHVSIQKCM